MDKLEGETVIALKTLFDKVAELQKINVREILKPEIYVHYEKTLQAAYDALTKVERTINSLGMKLEYQHWRIGEAIEELEHLAPLTHIQSDEVTLL